VKVVFNIGGESEPLTVGLETGVTGVFGDKLTGQLFTAFDGDVRKVAVAWAESSHEQFGEDGYPLYGPSDGFGVMQLDTIPDFKKREEHFWDWRANARKGAEYLDELYHKDALKIYLITHHENDEQDRENPS